VADEDDVVEIFVVQDGGDVGDVHVQVDVGAEEV
jgi:hypothetical protein